MDSIATSNPISTVSVATYSPISLAAIMKGNEVMAAAYKELGDLVGGTLRSHFDQTLSACQAMAKAESVTDAMTIQVNYMRGYTQTALAGSTGLMQATQRLAREAMASAAARLNHAGGMGS